MAEERLSEREVRKDFFFFWWLFSVVVGAPSIIVIVQSVFYDHQLIAPIQALIDGYNRLLGLLGLIVEPWAQPIVKWLTNLLNVELILHPHWRPLFVLVMVFVMALVRTAWSYGNRLNATLFFLFAGSLGLTGCLAAGLLSLTGPWWAQGLIAALPVGLVILGEGLRIGGFIILFGSMPAAASGGTWTLGVAIIFQALMVFVGAFLLGVGLFLLGAIFTAIFPIAAAGLVGLGITLLLISAVMIFVNHGKKNSRTFRVGLTIIGAYMGAGLVYALDWVVRAAGWAG